MSSLIELVEKANFNPAAFTDIEVRKGEKEVGVMSESLKRLWSLYNDANTQNKERVKGARKKHVDFIVHIIQSDKEPDLELLRKHQAEIEQLQPELTLARLTCEAFGDIFWAAARIEFPELLGKPNIGVRKGFKLVITTPVNEDQDDAPRGFLVRLTSIFRSRS